MADQFALFLVVIVVFKFFRLILSQRIVISCIQYYNHLWPDFTIVSSPCLWYIPTYVVNQRMCSVLRLASLRDKTMLLLTRQSTNIFASETTQPLHLLKDPFMLQIWSSVQKGQSQMWIVSYFLLVILVFSVFFLFF